MIDRWPGHNFSVAARSLLIGEINVGLPRDFNGLRVAKISPFATSALIVVKQALYCMRRADLCGSGETASISFYTTLCSSCLRCRRSNQVPAAGGHLASPRPGAHCSGTTVVCRSHGARSQGRLRLFDSSDEFLRRAIAVLSRPVTRLSALAPAQRAGAQRLSALAHSVSYCVAKPCPKSGVKPTCRLDARTSQFDPTETSSLINI